MNTTQALKKMLNCPPLQRIERKSALKRLLCIWTLDMLYACYIIFKISFLLFAFFVTGKLF